MQPRIICYHRVSNDFNSYLRPTKVEDFENQMRYLTKAYNPVSLEKMVQHIQNRTPLPTRSIAITFDDGYRDNYENAYPIMEKYGIPATIFLITNFVGTGDIPSWDKAYYRLSKAGKRTRVSTISKRPQYDVPLDEKSMPITTLMLDRFDKRESNHTPADYDDVRIDDYEGKDLMLSWEQVRDMSDNGISCGSHTLTHPFLTRISRAQARREIHLSKEIIEQQTGKPVTTFSYPSGDFDSDIEGIIKETGYSAAVSTITGYNSLCDNLYALRRNVVQLKSTYHKLFPLSFLVEITDWTGHIRELYHKVRRF